MSVLPVGFGSAAGGTPAGAIERSLRFNSADDAYVSRTFSTPTNNKKWSYSVWMKRSAFAANQTIMSSNVDGAEYWDMRFNTSDQILVQNRVGSSNLLLANTTAVYRDPSAWYHIVFVFDSDNATAAFRNRLYVNNVEYTLSANSGSGNASAWNVNAIQHNIGVSRTLTTGGGIWAEFSGYETEIYFIDGQALTPSSFGETDSNTGVWKPKAFSGTYGTNGFYLKFADNSNTTAATLGKDSSGNGNNWTPNNFSVTAGVGNDSLVDSPTSYGTDTGVGGEVRGNYATLNPLDNGGLTLTNGNLDANRVGSSWLSVRATIQGITSGKWYWECTTPSSITSTNYPIVGVAWNKQSLSIFCGQDAYGYGCSFYSGQKYNNNVNTNYGSAFATNDVMGIAFDADNGKIWFSKNGTWFASGDPVAGTNAAYTGITGQVYSPTFSVYASSSSTVVSNFGQRPFAYTAPSGFKALCTQNLPTPTIGATSTTQANDYFDATLYTGNGTTTTVTNSGSMQPDLVWVKNRTTAQNHVLVDVLRGNTYGLFSNLTDAEFSDGGFPTITSTGFSVGASSWTNQNGSAFVGWQWKANGAGSSNTAGTITSTVSASTTSGFSIVKYTGTAANATVGHGLGAVPSMLIIKERGVVDGWAVYHVSVGNQRLLSLNSTNAQSGTSAAYWNNTTPTSTVFSVGTDNKTNGSNAAGMICYAFAPVAGYSAFGSYTGNGSADGPFVYANHRPAFLLVKRTDTTSNWTILDFQREGYNVDNDPLFPNLSNAEGTTDLADLLSNGFKLRSTDASVNASGGTYIYMSLASNPFKYSLGR